jgi:hypothetical protein
MTGATRKLSTSHLNEVALDLLRARGMSQPREWIEKKLARACSERPECGWTCASTIRRDDNFHRAGRNRAARGIADQRSERFS